MKIEKINDVCCVLEKALNEYPGTGPGLKQYRKKIESGDSYTVTGYMWDSIPMRYVLSLTGLTEKELRSIHQRDMDGMIFFDLVNGKQLIKISLRSVFDYVDPDAEKDDETIVEK